MSVVVKYSDVAIGAKEDFDFSAENYLPQSNIDLVKADIAPQKRYDIPFEPNSMLLDGGAQFLPDVGDLPELADIAFISEQQSDENGNFAEPIVFDFVSESTYTSAGIALTFDKAKGVYPTHINVSWYNGDSLLETEDFYPDSAEYFCNKKVSFYNKVSVSVFSLNLPNSRLRFNGIEYGLVVSFGADELRSAKIIQEIDPISANMPINTFDFSIESKKNIEFSFQTKQPIEVYFNGNKKATSFVRTAKRSTKTNWRIQSEDYIGLMDSIYFQGGVYSSKSVSDLLGEIFSTAKVPYSIEDEFSAMTVTGYIPYTSCRDALMQVCFAIGAVADTSNENKVRVYSLASSTSQQDISKERIMQGQSFSDETRVTAVELLAHSYVESSTSLVAYDASKSGTGTNIFVSFSEPLHTLSITSGTILQSGSNYAIINANSGCKLSGKKYEHTTIVKRIDNPLVLSTDIENVISIENATLISSDNVDRILNLCYNYIVNTEQTSMKIIDGKNDEPTTVGDFITFETDYLGQRQGRIIRQSFSLVGGILVKDSIVR